MQIRENLKLFFLLITTVATCIVAFATYRIYQEQSEQPTPTLEAYKIVGTQELAVADSTSLTLKKIDSQNGYDDYEVLLQITNGSNKDLEDVRVHIDVEGGELIVPSNWAIGTYADQPRYFEGTPLMQPHTSHKLRDVKIRIKGTTHEAKLKWSILAKRIVPPDGVLVFRF